jgi:Mn-containing catalase
VSVTKPDARFGTFLLEQFGGATGELTAALQYWLQSFHVENAGMRDMLQDIAMEEFGHLEMVGKLISQHTSKMEQTSVYDAPLFKVKGGGPHFLDSQGSCWTAAYINEGGNVVRDLRANIASEAGARQTYEALIKACEDEGTKKTLVHLLTREITHTNMFMKALDSMGKLTDPIFGNIPPDEPPAPPRYSSRSSASVTFGRPNSRCTTAQSGTGRRSAASSGGGGYNNVSSCRLPGSSTLTE